LNMSYGRGLGHYGVHVHDPKRIIDVSRDERKLRDVTMPTDDVVKCHKKK